MFLAFLEQMKLTTLVNVGLKPWGPIFRVTAEYDQKQGMQIHRTRAGTHILISFSAPGAVSTCH